MAIALGGNRTATDRSGVFTNAPSHRNPIVGRQHAATASSRWEANGYTRCGMAGRPR